ncbi:MAG: hypothetical protein LBT41_04545 [Candidatus Methanoplasma sp.]|jgi:hypothetical protein|nr:hypothetical protein [Candidatus Methanoplasma sp.]
MSGSREHGRGREGHEHDHEHDHEHEHDERGEHDALHLEMHRAVDELGKYAIEIDISSESGISKDVVKQAIGEAMRESTLNCMRNGADLIGHTKSFLLCADGNIMSSLLDEYKPIRIKDDVDSEVIHDAKFILHVIVHGIWDDKVRECTLAAVPGVFGRFNIPYRVAADYYDLEKSIAHHL